MDIENYSESAPPSLEEYAQTTARYDEVLSKWKLLRARLLLTSANISKDLQKGSGIQSDTSDLLATLDEMEKQFHCLSIQEEMLKKVKVSKLALELINADNLHEDLDDLLKEHCANQARLFELAKDIRQEKLVQKRAMTKLLDCLSDYSASLKNDQVKLDNHSSGSSHSTRNLELKKEIEKKIKEIRFMQICISQIVSNKNVDFREESVLKDILKSVRNPITSVENFL